MTESNAQEQKMNIKASDAVLAGRYVNAAQISHSKGEFTQDFMQLMPPQAQLAARVIMTPATAKRVMLALKDNIEKYEAQFGAIDASGPAPTEHGFRVA